ncbi:hypothetical protein LLH06_01030 [Mucilaginibacter daejeonensis]|uniref:ABC-three component system middle component 4 n=1 Tax=Mucilaginibacter daejeonensis TaxID=398049 RepID=UPI001D17C3CD|nr:ABC-three component system middle component 4 [Mucilaginibacter daejeonensis]UEG53559.1 hypothetical protein LLH06_01030 [Mucilaginibacter daejeonensis]
MALSFIVPDFELNTKLARALVILRNLSLNKAGNKILTIEKLAVYDFLLRHPHILHGILKSQGRKMLILRPEELTSINKEYPNTNGLYTHRDLSITLQILILQGYASANLTKDNEAVYTITAEGANFADGLETEYVMRLHEISNPINQLLSLNYRQLMAAIKPYINGK